MYLLQKIGTLLIVGVLLGCGAAPVLAQDGVRGDDVSDNEQAGDALEPLFPESLGAASLEQVEPESGLSSVGMYTHPDVDSPLALVLAYGATVEGMVAELTSMKMESEDWETEEWDIQGRNVHYMNVREMDRGRATESPGESGTDGRQADNRRTLAVVLVDQFLVGFMTEQDVEPALMRSLFEQYDLDALASWEAPGSPPRHSFAAGTCLSIACLMTSEDLETLFPASLGEASLEHVEPEDDGLRSRGVYTHPEVDGSLSLALAYGSSVEEGAMQISSLQMQGATESEDWHTEEWDIQGHTVHYMSEGGNAVAISLIDQFLVFTMTEGAAEPALFRSLFESYDLNALASWDAPGSYMPHSLSSNTCLSIECFSKRVASCESAQMMGQLNRRLGGVYTVEEPADEEQCLLSFAFTNNPNPDVVDKKVFFPVDRNADLVENFQDNVMRPMQACLEETDEASEHCGGPLLDVME
ncbi:hypothetical protein CRI93_02280 [Longimonas halophila]|uniref:Uncharacterized protein n=1 Tax=Longimonas halophila TaxID=1469170 RepID=A0A2H3P1X8_9BACT|nr:hypothetical protein [Longimonas halophila]PEN09580.1 hypothetical protein CRI93_02280 [Longimonas halophila]